jgi:hypothetical protein
MKEEKMVTAEGRIEVEKRALEFKLIEANAKIEKLTPKTLRDHMLYGRHEAARTHELQTLQAAREALIEQIRILESQLSTLLQAPTTKRVSRGPTKQKKIYDRVEKLLKKNPDKSKNELFGIVAEAMGMKDEAVHERYNQQQRKEVTKKAAKHSASHVDPKGPTNKKKSNE